MDILRNTQGRVFVSTGITDEFKYYGAMSVGAIEKTRPSIESVLTIDKKGNTIKIAEVKDHDVQPSSSSLTGYIPLLSKSSLEKLLSKTGVEIQVHFGTCKNPSDFNSFDSALVLRRASLTNYSVSEPSTLVPNRAVLQETANITIDNSYRVFTPKFNQVFGEAGVLGMLGIGYAESKYCSIENKNLDILIIYYKSGGYTRFSYSLDNGVTWQTHFELFSPHTGGPTQTALEVAKNKIYYSYMYLTDSYLVVTDVGQIISNTASASSLISKYPSNAIIKDMSATSSYLWCAGGSSASFVMRVDLSNNTTEILDNDEILTGVEANAIDALNDNFVVIVGENNNVALYQNGEFFLSSIGIDSLAFLSDIKVFTENHWIVASNMGLYITIDGGRSWKKTFPVENTCKFAFYDDIFGYAANTDGVYRTADGGNTWVKVANPSWTNINKAAIDINNPNNIFLLETFFIYSSL